MQIQSPGWASSYIWAASAPRPDLSDQWAAPAPRPDLNDNWPTPTLRPDLQTTFSITHNRNIDTIDNAGRHESQTHTILLSDNSINSEIISNQTYSFHLLSPIPKLNDSLHSWTPEPSPQHSMDIHTEEMIHKHTDSTIGMHTWMNFTRHHKQRKTSLPQKLG